MLYEPEFQVLIFIVRVAAFWKVSESSGAFHAMGVAVLLPVSKSSVFIR